MRFTDGYWHMRPGVTPHYAVQAHEIEVEDKVEAEVEVKALVVYAATKALKGRGDTLNLPLLTVLYSSPLENVIRVQVVHHKGGVDRGRRSSCGRGRRPRCRSPTTPRPRPSPAAR